MSIFSILLSWSSLLSKMSPLLIVFFPFFLSLTQIAGGMPVTLFVPFNAIGLRGNITFHQERTGGSVQISVHLRDDAQKSGSNSTESFKWAIYPNPVFYNEKSRCSTNELGKMERDMSQEHGPIFIPPLKNEVQQFVDSGLVLEGLKTIWGRSVWLKSEKTQKEACSNIFDTNDVKTAEATFTGPVAGKVVFRENSRGETLIYSNLIHTKSENRVKSTHPWKILVTDILDTRRSEKCDYLITLLDPDGTDYTQSEPCSKTNHKACQMGNLMDKHGGDGVSVGAVNSRYSKQFFIDTHLPLTVFESTRSSYLVLYHKTEVNKVFTCAKITPVSKREVKAVVDVAGVKGYFRFSQAYSTDPTVVTIELKGLNGRGRFYHVHEFPVPPRRKQEDNLCSNTAVGGHFNPFAVDAKQSPMPGIGTNDAYEVGDLSGKYGEIQEDPFGNFFAIYVDMNLPLFGKNSIVGRSVVIHKPDKSRWICATIGYPGPVLTAVARFYYPVSGEIIMRQDSSNPFSETTVLASVIYSDGSVNTTTNHLWHVHVNPPGKDFYSWEKRCESAGGHFNPFQINPGKVSKCGRDDPLRCEVGDLVSKSQKLTVSARLNETQKLFYTDIMLPLSGQHNIIGRSLVIHDERAPAVRGNRMACATIFYINPLTAAVRSWKVGTGIESNVSGSIVFHQATEYDETSVKVNLHGLNELASGFHVHKVQVPVDKEFPCSSDSVYDHYNPYAVDVEVGPSPGVGSSDQYEVGDLSGKYGTLSGKYFERKEMSDINLPLHGPRSILGRSVVIHKEERRFRWTCSSIKVEVEKEKARQIIAIATFDDPRSLVAGFIRFTQLEYLDGGFSDTWMEVDLKYSGFNNRNLTKNHNWAVYVNQVGEDAFSAVDTVRCLASGYIWNPYLVDSKLPFYSDCNEGYPARCQMGDLSGKHGKLEIGGKRVVFSDSNLPLFGNYSVIGRSVVIFDRSHPSIKIACANIKPDIHLVSNVAIKKYPTFTTIKFMEHMRALLNTTPWLVHADSQGTREILDGECVQLMINFFGPEAYRLQIEFSNLINLGSVRRSDRFGTRTIFTYYRPCRSLREMNTTGKASSNTSLWVLIVATFTILKLA